MNKDYTGLHYVIMYFKSFKKKKKKSEWKDWDGTQFLPLSQHNPSTQ